MQLFKQEHLGLAVGMWHVKLFITLSKMTLKIIKQHDMAEILTEKNLGNAKMPAVCTSLVGLPSVCTLACTP